MAAELFPSPIDEQTGLPLPILPVEPPTYRRSDLHLDYHHHWFIRRDPRLNSPGGLSVRYSYGQKLPRWLHSRYHNLSSGPPLPEEWDSNEQFRLAVLGCAGLIGPYAVDVTGDDWREPLRMTSDQYAYVTDPKRLHIEAYATPHAGVTRNHLGKFFAAHAVEQELTHLPKRAIKSFLHTKDPVRRRELGNLLLSESIELAVAPLKPIKIAFAEAYDQPNIRGWDLGLKVRKFFPVDRFSEYYGVLAQRLLDNEVAWA
jgi:hypothetical protein